MERLFFIIPKYTSNVAFNNWCYNLSSKFFLMRTDLIRDNPAELQRRLTKLEKDVKEMQLYIELTMDDGK
jgi:hypothetical protein